MAKVRLLARIMRATFNGFAIGTLAAFAIYGLTKALEILAGKVVVDPLGSAMMVFFAFLTGSLGIELSKDIEAKLKEE